MLLFWRGYGWLVPIIIYATFVVSQFFVDAFYGEGFYAATTWPQYMATYIGTFLLGVFGYIMNYVKREDLIDEETGEAVGKAPPHSLLFIPVEYWAFLMLISGPLTPLEWPTLF